MARLRVRALACAVGTLLIAPAASFGLELGEATIRSSLGQSLRVEIPYRLAADERLTPACVGLAAPRADGALPRYTRVRRVEITPTHIEIFGDSRVLEPLIALTVDVHCNTAPRFMRNYELFVDLPAREPVLQSNDAQLASARAGAPISMVGDETVPAAASVATTNSGPATTVQAVTTPRASVSARARGHAGGNLTQGQTYVVVRGDTLSGIAARVGDRPATIRETAEAIFAANPGAFTRGNRDLIEAGSAITIPLMTAALPELPVVAPVPLVTGPEPVVAPLPSTELAPDGAPSALSVESPASIVPAQVELPATEVIHAQPSVLPAPIAVTPEMASAAPAGRAWPWLPTLLALGVVIALSVPLLFLRRRKPEAPTHDRVKIHSSPPRALVDPTAGIDVVEAELPRAASAATAMPAAPSRAKATVDAASTARSESIVINVGSVESVDLDVGMPTMVDESSDWVADRTGGLPAATSATANATLGTAAIVAMPEPEPESAATVGQPPLEPAADVAELAADADAEQHTLTVVQLDMLRQDYEAEHTMTQEASKELRDALADLKATQAARAANDATADTATVEMPQQPQAEPIEAQPTQRLRSSR